jgi:hypothetical protein
MRIERFHIQGFKSIADVEVEGLSDINVFYGLNDVGKSNIFQALALWRWALGGPSKAQSEQPEREFDLELRHRRPRIIPIAEWKQFGEEFGSPLLRLGGNNRIWLKVEVILDQRYILEQGALIEAAGKEIASRFDSLSPAKMRIVSEVEVGLLPLPTEAQRKVQQYRNVHRGYIGELQFDISAGDLSSILPGFHIIQATRRFQVEQKGKGNDLGSVSDHNLKQALFYAYLSPDPPQKRRLAAIRRILAGPPFSLGELDVALDPATDRIDIGFVRPEGRLPLENLGSGSQQLLMVLGQIFLNDYPIIAIEEPEMNLSPQYQQHLLVALRKLMQDPDVKLSQLFISTHSPYFEFEESFFDVTLDEQGATQVTRLPIEKRDRYFPDTRVGPEMGSRLNSLNQITLYDGVIKDLGLQRGDLVLFRHFALCHCPITRLYTGHR